ncbi:hypothetical protein T484DRAFT_1749750 [Baffinella frigidus]|nr:hypothetical protein T484DRAFT_1749750 [Cryptophyta sp. CCMP2293]
MSPRSQLAILRKLAKADIDSKNPSVATLIRTMEKENTTISRTYTGESPVLAKRRPPPLARVSSTPVLPDAPPSPLRTSTRLSGMDPLESIDARTPLLMRHLQGECLRHPAGKCTCKAVTLLEQDGAWLFMGQRFNARNPPSPRDHPERKTRTLSLKQKEGPNSPSLSSTPHSRRCTLTPLIAAYHKTLPRAAPDAAGVFPVTRCRSLGACACK